MKFKVGSLVQWKWLGRPIEGKVKKTFIRPVTKTIKGKAITRNGSPENPAHLVISEAGNEALKLASELSVRARIPKSLKPKMF